MGAPIASGSVTYINMYKKEELSAQLQKFVAVLRSVVEINEIERVAILKESPVRLCRMEFLQLVAMFKQQSIIERYGSSVATLMLVSSSYSSPMPDAVPFLVVILSETLSIGKNIPSPALLFSNVDHDNLEVVSWISLYEDASAIDASG